MSNIKYDVNEAFSKLLETPLNDEGRCYFVDGDEMYEILDMNGTYRPVFEIVVSNINKPNWFLKRTNLNDKMISALKDSKKLNDHSFHNKKTFKNIDDTINLAPSIA